MKDKGFIRIGDWHLKEPDRLDISYPPSIHNVKGVIAILVNNELMLLSSTSHYGRRIGDFQHAINGNTQSARIHSNIVGALKANKTVSLWVKDSPTPTTDKRLLLTEYSPPWNL